MEPQEGPVFLADLSALTTAPDRVYRHGWRVGDLIVCDNWGTIHRAVLHGGRRRGRCPARRSRV